MKSKNTKLRRGGRTNGFTLVEVAIAIAILGLVMVGAYQLVSRTGYLSRLARDHYVAVHLAKNRLERTRNFAYVNLYLMADSAVVMDEYGVPTTDGNFRRTTTVTTNWGVNLTRVLVQVDVRDVRSGNFEGDKETIDMLFTPYLVKP